MYWKSKSFDVRLMNEDINFRGVITQNSLFN
jgi:hypothetical protein